MSRADELNELAREHLEAADTAAAAQSWDVAAYRATLAGQTAAVAAGVALSEAADALAALVDHLITPTPEETPDADPQP